jgi:hypothetical protein
MPIPAIRRYTELVRQGIGNEKERLAIMCGHREEVTAQIARLTESLDLINYKVGVYEDLLAAYDEPSRVGEGVSPAPAVGAPTLSPRRPCG